MVVSNSNNLSKCRNSFLNAVGTVVRLTKEQTSSHENVAERIVDLKVHVSRPHANHMTTNCYSWQPAPWVRAS